MRTSIDKILYCLLGEFPPPPGLLELTPLDKASTFSLISTGSEHDCTYSEISSIYSEASTVTNDPELYKKYCSEVLLKPQKYGYGLETDASANDDSSECSTSTK